MEEWMEAAPLLGSPSLLINPNRIPVPNLIQRLGTLRGTFELQIVSDEAKRRGQDCKRAFPSARGCRCGFWQLFPGAD